MKPKFSYWPEMRAMKRELVGCVSAVLLLGSAAQSQYLLNMPESVVYDSTYSRYLVTNKGDGQIISIDLAQNQDYFATGLSSCRGITIVAGVAYVACDYGVRGFDLSSATEVFAVSVPDMVFLNDIEADTSGYLYVSDSSTGKVYKIRISDGSVTTLVSSGLSGSNGLIYDRRHDRLLVCCWGANASIYSINTSTGAVTLMANTGFSNLDGLTEDTAGNIYVSSWGQSAVYRYPITLSGVPLAVSTGHNGPADIYFNKLSNTLAVPNFNANTVSFVNLDVDGDDVLIPDDNCPHIANPQQLDADHDGVGDACDDCTDTDSDGFGDPGYAGNVCAIDNCPDVSNPGQADTDNDGVGDACCCLGVRGNVNYSGIVDLADLSALVSYLTGGGYVISCPNEGNVNAAGIIDLADLSALVSYLTGGGYVLPSCP